MFLTKKEFALAALPRRSPRRHSSAIYIYASSRQAQEERQGACCGASPAPSHPSRPHRHTPRASPTQAAVAAKAFIRGAAPATSAATGPPRKQRGAETTARRGVLLRWVCRVARHGSGARGASCRRLVLKSFELVSMPSTQSCSVEEAAADADAPAIAAKILARSPNLRPGAIVTAVVPLAAVPAPSDGW